MDAQRKKELKMEWKNRKAEMGVVYIRCTATEDTFLGISKDTRAWYNRHDFQLTSNMHRNRKLQGLWNQYGAENFEHGVLKVLEYEDETENLSKKLEDLFKECMSTNANAIKL